MRENFNRNRESKIFDDWSSSYDDDVEKFVVDRKVGNILDVGIGTGTLARKISNICNITGIDFSEEMLEKAKEAMPNIELIKWDFSKGLPETIKSRIFDIVICNYAIHHLDSKLQKILLEEMLGILNEDGVIIIADVLTKTTLEMNEAKREDFDIWDEDENYIIFDEVKNWFKYNKIEMEKLSYCSGIIYIYK